uniref:Uncharacterized protein n=1 Tax=Rhizophora mucronata TaxID=61149 RepID=A0A2P2MXP5_RHIMU
MTACHIGPKNLSQKHFIYYFFSLPTSQLCHGWIPLGAPAKFICPKYWRDQRVWVLNNCFVITFNPGELFHHCFLTSNILCYKAHSYNIVQKVPACTSINK